jgi:hypothetical protein
MSAKTRLVALAAGLTLLSTGVYGSVTYHHRQHGPKVQRYASEEQRGCPVRQLADGSLVDCQGWRKWSGSIGWDNSCLNLDYLPSDFACSSNGRR